MDTSVTNRRKTWIRRIALASTLGVALVAVAMGVAVYRFFTERPGEGALRLVPANALIAVSVDLSPSVSQAAAFKKIDDALARNELKGFVENAFADMLDSTKSIPALREVSTRSGAFALLATDRSKKDAGDPTVFFLSVSDGPRVAQALAKAGRVQFYKGVQYYQPKAGGLAMFVVDDVLVVSPNPANLRAVKDVATHEQPGLTSIPEYAAARARLDGDSNVMFFLNPSMLKSTDPDNAEIAKIADSVGWVAFGLAIRDGGVSLSVHGSVDPTKFPAFASLADIKPIRSDLYKILPGGAYGAAAVCQEGTIADVVMSTVENLGAKDEVARFRKDFADGTGVDIRNDLLPALQGDFVVALYPSAGVEVGGADILAIVDDKNGANPAKIAETFRETLDKSFQNSEKKGPLMAKADDPDGARWNLAEPAQHEMDDALGKAFNSPEVNGELLARGKTVVYATRGNTVFLATSKPLMERALATYKTGDDSLAAESSLAQPTLLEDSQEIMVFNLAKIAKGVAATLNFDKMEQEPAKAIKGILAMFEALDTPLSAKIKLSSKDLGANLFIPLDYDRLVDFIGGQVKAANSHAAERDSAPAPAPVPARK